MLIKYLSGCNSLLSALESLANRQTPADPVNLQEDLVAVSLRVDCKKLDDFNRGFINNPDLSRYLSESLDIVKLIQDNVGDLFAGISLQTVLRADLQHYPYLWYERQDFIDLFAHAGLAHIDLYNSSGARYAILALACRRAQDNLRAQLPTTPVPSSPSMNPDQARLWRNVLMIAARNSIFSSQSSCCSMGAFGRVSIMPEITIFLAKLRQLSPVDIASGELFLTHPENARRPDVPVLIQRLFNDEANLNTLGSYGLNTEMLEAVLVAEKIEQQATRDLAGGQGVAATDRSISISLGKLGRRYDGTTVVDYQAIRNCVNGVDAGIFLKNIIQSGNIFLSNEVCDCLRRGEPTIFGSIPAVRDSSHAALAALNALYGHLVRGLEQSNPVLWDRLATKVKDLMITGFERSVNDSVGASSPFATRGVEDNHTVKEVVGLVWTALHDLSVVTFEHLPDGSQRPRDYSVPEAELRFMQSQLEAKVEYGDHESCPHGTVSKTVQSLENIHPDVEIVADAALNFLMVPCVAYLKKNFLPNLPDNQYAIMQDLFYSTREPIDFSREDFEVVGALKQSFFIECQQEAPILIRYEHPARRTSAAEEQAVFGLLMNDWESIVGSFLAPPVERAFERKPIAPLSSAKLRQNRDLYSGRVEIQDSTIQANLLRNNARNQLQRRIESRMEHLLRERAGISIDTEDAQRAFHSIVQHMAQTCIPTVADAEDDNDAERMNTLLANMQGTFIPEALHQAIAEAVLDSGREEVQESTIQANLLRNIACNQLERRIESRIEHLLREREEAPISIDTEDVQRDLHNIVQHMSQACVFAENDNDTERMNALLENLQETFIPQELHRAITEAVFALAYGPPLLLVVDPVVEQAAMDRLEQALTEPLPEAAEAAVIRLESAEVGGENLQSRFIRRTNLPSVGPSEDEPGPYGLQFSLPPVPVVFPYHPVEDGNGRIHQGCPTFSLAAKLPSGATGNLPPGVTTLLAQNSIDINNLDVLFCVQNKPWQPDVPLLLRPQAWLHPEAPDHTNDIEPLNLQSMVLVGLSDIEGGFSQLAVLEVQTHSDEADPRVVYSPNNMPIRGLQGPEQTESFYSLCINPETGKAALTLHWLLNDADFMRVDGLVSSGEVHNLADFQLHASGMLHDSVLNDSVQNVVRGQRPAKTPCEDLYELFHGRTETLEQAINHESRYQLAEQLALPRVGRSSVDLFDEDEYETFDPFAEDEYEAFDPFADVDTNDSDEQNRIDQEDDAFLVEAPLEEPEEDMGAIFTRFAAAPPSSRSNLQTAIANPIAQQPTDILAEIRHGVRLRHTPVSENTAARHTSSQRNQPPGLHPDLLSTLARRSLGMNRNPEDSDEEDSDDEMLPIDLPPVSTPSPSVQPNVQADFGVHFLQSMQSGATRSFVPGRFSNSNHAATEGDDPHAFDDDRSDDQSNAPPSSQVQAGVPSANPGSTSEQPARSNVAALLARLAGQIPIQPGLPRSMQNLSRLGNSASVSNNGQGVGQGMPPPSEEGRRNIRDRAAALDGMLSFGAAPPSSTGGSRQPQPSTTGARPSPTTATPPPVASGGFLGVDANGIPIPPPPPPPPPGPGGRR